MKWIFFFNDLEVKAIETPTKCKDSIAFYKDMFSCFISNATINIIRSLLTFVDQTS